MPTRCNDFDIYLTHLSSLASTTAATTASAVSLGQHHAAQYVALISVLSGFVASKFELGLQANTANNAVFQRFPKRAPVTLTPAITTLFCECATISG